MMAADYMREAEQLPLVDLAGLLPKGGALVVAPHPDDESLGCGGLIAELAGAGRPVRVVIVSDGAASHPNSQRYPRAALRALRRKEAGEAVRLLGAPSPVFLDWPDGAVPASGDGFARAVGQLAPLAQGYETVLAPSGLDPHADHAATSAIAREVAARLKLRMLSYPIWSWRYLYPEILPIEPREVAGPPQGLRLDISASLGRKRQAVMAHVTQTTRLIDDDPEGFILTPAMLAVLLRPFEVFLEDHP